jgi:hypothetical protein
MQYFGTPSAFSETLLKLLNDFEIFVAFLIFFFGYFLIVLAGCALKEFNVKKLFSGFLSVCFSTIIYYLIFIITLQSYLVNIYLGVIMSLINAISFCLFSLLIISSYNKSRFPYFSGELLSYAESIVFFVGTILTIFLSSIFPPLNFMLIALPYVYGFISEVIS